MDAITHIGDLENTLVSCQDFEFPATARVAPVWNAVF
jgi:hypothetical protein